MLAVPTSSSSRISPAASPATCRSSAPTATHKNPPPSARRHPLDFAVRLAGRVPARCWRGRRSRTLFVYALLYCCVCTVWHCRVYDRLCLAI